MARLKTLYRNLALGKEPKHEELSDVIEILENLKRYSLTEKDESLRKRLLAELKRRANELHREAVKQK